MKESLLPGMEIRAMHCVAFIEFCVMEYSCVGVPHSCCWSELNQNSFILHSTWIDISLLVLFWSTMYSFFDHYTPNFRNCTLNLRAVLVQGGYSPFMQYWCSIPGWVFPIRAVLVQHSRVGVPIHAVLVQHSRVCVPIHAVLVQHSRVGVHHSCSVGAAFQGGYSHSCSIGAAFQGGWSPFMQYWCSIPGWVFPFMQCWCSIPGWVFRITCMSCNILHKGFCEGGSPVLWHLPY
jgi:hypothetical protein